jgi:carbon storage regulator
MLLLDRRVGETIQVGENIFITVQEIAGNRVRLQFDAPRSVAIFRTEVLRRERKKNERVRAVVPSGK